MIILLARFGAIFFRDVVQWEWLYYVAGAIGVIFLVSLCDELNDRFKRLPFGPMRLPIFGNRVQLALWGGGVPYKAITSLAKGYRGGFMKIFFGLTGYVTVNGHDRITEVITEDEWAGERDETWRIDRTTENKAGSSLMVWVSRRNIAMRCLADHALTRRETLNSLIQKQVAEYLDSIENQERVDKLGIRELSADVFLPFALSTVWSVLTGNPDIEVTDRRVHSLHRCLKEWEEKSQGFAGWADNYPFLVRWFPSWVGHSKLQEASHDFRKVLKSLIKEQYKKAESKMNPESFVQACVREFAQLRKQSFGATQMNDSSSIALLFEFLCPGPLIISSHVAFCLSHASRDISAQERIVAEISAAFAPDEIPTLDKIEELPFTAAFILETARYCSIVPLERRKLLRLERLGDTRFPKDMPLLLNYHSANMDPKVWEEPEKFKPERFLNKEGTKVINEEKLISLQAEKHLCAGYPLLRAVVFSFLTGTLARFRVEHWGANKRDKGAQFGLINKPTPFRVLIKPRTERPALQQ